MPDILRRVVLRPPDATPEHLPQLFHALAEAIETQNRLASLCPYVLRLTSGLQQDDRAFYVEHEPATPVNPSELFDSAAPVAPPEELIQATVALTEALATAHGLSPPPAPGRPAVHGGLCPGVLLRDSDGLWKVTDFGFAPAVCRVFGVESYLSLAVGPRDDGTGVWEVLSRDVIDRDDRLCAFVDPDKYGQEAWTSFEAGSDLLATGLILRLLAEHKHAYLGHEPEAHRIIDMAQMMSFGVPIRLARKDLRDAAGPELQAWRELVWAMLARVPGERPTATEVAQRLLALAPQKADPGVLKAQRWAAQLEAMLEAKAWIELQAALGERPPVKQWPPELLARVTDVEKRVAEYVAEAGRRATAEAELKTAQRWLDRLQGAVNAEQWAAAQTLLDEKPKLEHWPEQVSRELEPLAAQVRTALAAEKARIWCKALQKACGAKDWAAVGRRFAQRPAPEDCPPDVLESVATIEAAYQRFLEDEERHRRQIAAEQRAVREWLDHAQQFAAGRQWVEAIDNLAQPPQVEHWPEGAEEEAEQLRETCRLNLGDTVAANLDQVTESLRRQGEAVVHELIGRRFGGLLRPEHVAVTVEYVMWAPPDTDADGRAPLAVRLSGRAGAAPQEEGAAESVHGALDFALGGQEVRIRHGLDELRERVTEYLTEQLTRIQAARLAEFSHRLGETVFKAATLRAASKGVGRELAGELRLLGERADAGIGPLALKWNDQDLAWAPADPAELGRRAEEVATAAVRRAVLAEILARSQVLRTVEGALALDLAGTPTPTAFGLPKSIAFEAHLAVAAGAVGRQALGSGTVTCNQIDKPSLALDLAKAEEELGRLISRAQDASRKALGDDVQRVVRETGGRAKVVVPKRSKVPVAQLTFEVRPKGADPLALDGHWNAATWVYELPSGWQERVVAALTPEPAPAPAPSPKARAVAAPGPQETAGRPAQAAGRAGRRGLILGVAAAVVVVGGVGSYFALSGKSPEVAPVEVTSTPVQPAGETPTPPTEVADETPAPPTEVAGETPASPTEVASETPASPPEPVERPVVPPEERPGEEEVVQKPVDEPNEPSVAVQVDLVESLRDAWKPRLDLSDPQGVPLDALLERLIPSAARAAETDSHGDIAFLAAAIQGGALVSELKELSGHSVALTVGLNLRGEVAPRSQTFAVLLTEEGWTPDPGNVAALGSLAASARESLLGVVAQARPAMEAARREGRLADFHARAAALEDVLAPLAAAPAPADVEAVLGLLRSTPPLWETVGAELVRAGYQPEGGLEGPTGYPPRLRDEQGHTLRRVSVPPGDALWGRLTEAGLAARDGDPLRAMVHQTDAERPWLLYYIEEEESAADGYAEARRMAEERGRSVPTRDEWMAAALALRPSADVGGAAEVRGMMGGLWEWCDDAVGVGDGKHWLCGGSQVLLDRQPRSPRLPGAADGVEVWWRWLTHPLVMQRRAGEFGDQLTGVRTVLRIPGPAS